MSQGRFSRWLFRAKIACAAAVTLFGFDLPFFGYFMVPIALLVIGTGMFWLVRLLIRPAPGETEVPPRRKQVALLLGTSVLMLLVLLGVTASIRLGAGAGGPRRAWQPGAPMSPSMVDPDLGWSPFGPPDVVGQRLQKMDPSRPRVLLMGDSILLGMNLSDEEQVGHKLEALMPGVQVLNASVSGYSIDQYLLTLERVVPATKPKLIVVGIFTGNDFQISSREFSWGNHKPVLRKEGDRLVRADVGGPCIDRLSRSLLFRLIWQNRELAADSIESICRPVHLSRGEAERSISAMFDAMDRLAKAHGARILYALLPVDSEYNTYARERYLYVSRHLDLWRLLGETPRERFDFSVDLFRGGDAHESLFFEDHAHLKAPGHDLLASALLREIQARGLFSP